MWQASLAYEHGKEPTEEGVQAAEFLVRACYSDAHIAVEHSALDVLHQGALNRVGAVSLCGGSARVKHNGWLPGAKVYRGSGTAVDPQYSNNPILRIFKNTTNTHLTMQRSGLMEGCVYKHCIAIRHAFDPPRTNGVGV